MVLLTSEDLDGATIARLRAEATRRGVAPNLIIREALERELPVVSPSDGDNVYHDLDSLAGGWSEDEARAFLSGIEEFGRIDGKLWK